MKKIRGKSLQEWKEYSEKDIHNIPIRTRKYIIILEELVEQSLLFGVGIELPTKRDMLSKELEFTKELQENEIQSSEIELWKLGFRAGFIYSQTPKDNGN